MANTPPIVDNPVEENMNEVDNLPEFEDQTEESKLPLTSFESPKLSYQKAVDRTPPELESETPTKKRRRESLDHKRIG